MPNLIRMATDNPTKYPARMGQPWETEEINQLLAFIQAGLSTEEIALKHERTNGSIQAYKKKLAYEFWIQQKPLADIKRLTGLSESDIGDAVAKYENSQKAPTKKQASASSDDITSIRKEITALRTDVTEILRLIHMIYDFEASDV